MREHTFSSVAPPVPAVLSRVASVPLNIVFFGPPGAGKGTQAERFCARHGVPKISTGEMLRNAVHQATELGGLVKDTLRRGALVGDDLMIEVVRERLDRPDTAAGFVLDGFPRTVAQARALDDMVRGRGPLVVIALRVDPDVLVERLSARGRADDTEIVIRERLDIYADETAPVVDFYVRRGMIALLEGNRAPEAVADAIEAVVARSVRVGEIV